MLHLWVFAGMGDTGQLSRKGHIPGSSRSSQRMCSGSGFAIWRGMIGLLLTMAGAAPFPRHGTFMLHPSCHTFMLLISHAMAPSLPASG